MIRAPKVLVLDGHCDASVAATQSLGRAGAIVTVAARDRSAISCRSKYAVRALQQPAALPDELAKWVVSVSRSDDFSLVIPSTEASLIAIRLLPEDHPVRMKCVIPGNSSLDIALNKFTMGQIAQLIGMEVPETRLITDVIEDDPPWGYPTVLKPVRSKFKHEGSIITGDAMIARNKRERIDYQHLWLQSTPIVEQEYVAGTGVAVSILCEQGIVRWHFAHERLRELPLAGGPSTYRRSIACPYDSLQACERFAKVLDWHGVAMIEFKYDKHYGKLTFLEVNPRLWGSLALAIRAGVNFPVGLLRLACGSALAPQPKYRIDYYGRNIDKDLTWLREWRKNEHDGLDPPSLPSRPAALGELRRVLMRRESWDHFDVRDARTGFHIIWRMLAKQPTP